MLSYTRQLLEWPILVLTYINPMVLNSYKHCGKSTEGLERWSLSVSAHRRNQIFTTAVSFQSLINVSRFEKAFDWVKIILNNLRRMNFFESWFLKHYLKKLILFQRHAPEWRQNLPIITNSERLLAEHICIQVKVCHVRMRFCC